MIKKSTGLKIKSQIHREETFQSSKIKPLCENKENEVFIFIFVLCH